MEDNREFFCEADKIIRDYSKRVKKVCDDLSKESIMKLYEHLIMSVFLYDTSHTKCFMRIMEEKIKEMDFEGTKRVHGFKFKKIVEEAANVLLAYKEDISDKRDLEECKTILGNEIKDILKNLSKGTKSFKIRDFVDFHRVIIRAIIEPQIEENMRELEKEKILALAEDKFVKSFGRHYGFLECGKLK